MMTGRKILVVDDDPSIREILSLQLTRLGFEVATAGDGLEAVTAFKAGAPDVILMDLMMPRLDGLAACQQIRAVEKKTGAKRTPVLFLTARDSTHDKTSAALSGGDEFVAKPVSIRELTERLEAILLRKGKP
ncbi:MAG: response regulator transcription factor [Elusimicrobiota bacterium]|nr:response regulator transcription factor [Elusimicrobiota bacterium]